MNLHPADLTAVELVRDYAVGRLTPLDALEGCLERVARLNPLLNAIVTLDADGARRLAAESTERWRRGTPLSGLDGVPIAVKDNLLVRGLRCTWGSRLFSEFVPERDELPVARVRAAGLVILGKTNVPEFTLQGYTDNPLFGPTRNPWDPRLTPGGSSGGAVAAVASGMAPLALCTDGGGSIRRPASHCGLIGHKPTAGRVARGFGFPTILSSFEVVGPIARSPADADALMHVIAGRHRTDPSSLGWPDWHPDNDSRRVRIAYVASFAGSPVDPEIAGSVAEAAAMLGRLGHRVAELRCPFDVEAVGSVFGAVSESGLAWLLQAHVDRLHECGTALRSMAERGARLAATDYVAATAQAERLKQQLGQVFDDWDLIMTPTAAALPWPVEQSHPAEIAGQPVGPRGHAVFTAFANVAGCPAISIPCAPSRDNLPIGFQLVSEAGRDEHLFSVASEYLQDASHLERPAVLSLQ